MGLCAEFPSLSWLAATPGEALSGIQRLVADCVDDMQTNGEPVPEPMADRAYRSLVPCDIVLVNDLAISPEQQPLKRIGKARQSTLHHTMPCPADALPRKIRSPRSPTETPTSPVRSSRNNTRPSVLPFESRPSVTR